MRKPKIEVRLLGGFLMVLICLTAYGKLVADPQETKSSARLRGTWKMTSIEESGRKIKPPVEILLTFKQDTVEQTFGGQSETNEYQLDADHPAHLDIIKDGDGERLVYKMIFLIEKDVLKLCSGEPGADRPKKFSSQAGYSIQRLERVEARDK